MRKVVLGGHKGRSACSAFTLVEVMVAVWLGAIMFVGLYLGFSQGFAVIQLTRENLRATQILQEKAETIRLFNWDDLNAATNPYLFTNWYSPNVNLNKRGLAYSGTRIISNAPLSESYSNDVRLVTFQLTWSSGKVQRNREFSTLVSRYGLHDYIVEYK